MADYIDIRIHKDGDKIEVLENGTAIDGEIVEYLDCPIDNPHGVAKSLDVALIWRSNPGCVWIRGRRYCW